MKCFYSETLDGIAAAAVLLMAHPKCEMKSEYELSINEITDGEQIWLVGCSFDDLTMLQLSQQEEIDLVWVDYLIKPASRDPRIKGLRAENFGIGELMFQLVHTLPAAHSPRTIRYIGRYQVGNRDYHDDVVPLYWGMKSVKNLTPSHHIWKPLLLGDDREEVAIKVMTGREVVQFVEAEAYRQSRRAELKKLKNIKKAVPA